MEDHLRTPDAAGLGSDTAAAERRVDRDHPGHHTGGCKAWMSVSKGYNGYIGYNGYQLSFKVPSFPD